MHFHGAESSPYIMLIQTLLSEHEGFLTYRLGPRVKKIKNGYPESSKVYYSINLKQYVWCIRNHCIANSSELHNATIANKLWQPMCVICMHALNANVNISATRYQIAIKLPFGNDNVFVYNF